MALGASFFARGIPKPQPRQRAAAIYGKDGKAHGHSYDPGTANDWRGDVIRAGAPVRPPEPWEHALSLRITLYLPRPKRLLRKSEPEGPIWCPASGDWDNYGKAISDCLQADGWFRNDNQVVEGTVRKLYHAKTGCPGAMIEIAQAGLVFDAQPA